MATVILVRHGRTTANASGILAGRTAGVRLDETGRTQAARTAERIAAAPVVGVVSSPLERCRQTAKYILDAQATARAVERTRADEHEQKQAQAQAHAHAQPQPEAQAQNVDHQEQATPLSLLIDRAITECDYGEWQGRPLKDLAQEKLWSVVQRQPSAAAFPGGESMATMQARSVAAIRRHDAAFEEQYGAGAVWVAVSHGDIIKSILADALGMHLDLFQRINVGPASISIVRYGEGRTDVVATNSDAGDLSWLRAAAPAADAAVGGGAGTSGTA